MAKHFLSQCLVTCSDDLLAVAFVEVTRGARIIDANCTSELFTSLVKAKRG